MTAHVLRFPLRAHDQAPTLFTYVRQRLQARADARLRAVADHMLAPATDASDAAIDRVLATHRQRVDKIERSLMALIEELDGEAQA